MKSIKLFTIVFLSFFLTSAILGQIEINNETISNLQISGGGLSTSFGHVNYDSYGHNFLHNSTKILEIDEFGLDMKGDTRFARKQPGGLKVDMLPYAYGVIERNSTSTTILNDTGNYTATGNDSGVITLTFSDSSINTSRLVVLATPIANDIVAPSQVTIEHVTGNVMRIYLYTSTGGSISNYGVNLLVFKP